MTDELIRRADIMAGLTSAEMQKKLKQGTGEEAYNVFLDFINSSPAVDAIEVVRCRDCKYWHYGDCYRQELTRPEDFCSYGEEKDNGTA